MPASTRYLLVVSMDITPEKEALFNEVYDTEHVPYLLEVPGVRSVQRFTAAPFEMSMGGSMTTLGEGAPRYSAIYEIDSPGVLKSPEWAEAIERGRWGSEIRPHASNRQHELRELMTDS